MTIMLALALILGGCAGGTKEASREEAASTEEQTIGGEEAASAEEQTSGGDGVLHLTMHFVDPASSPYAEGGVKIARLVEEATEGKIQIEVLSDGVLGGERDTLAMAMDGELDIATCANSVMTNYIPQMNILDQAYLWKNAREAHAAVDGTLGDLIREKALALKLHVIGFEESGFRNTFSTRPIQTMEDFQGVTIRTMENKYHQAAFQAFGADTVALPYTEVMGALESGEVDACENATANCLNSGYYEVTKHVTNTSHAFVYILLCMSDDAYQRIPEDLIEPFLNAVQEGVAWERTHLEEANASARKALEDLGVSFYDIDVSALQQAYQKKAREEGFNFDEQWQAAVDEAIAAAQQG